LQTVAGSNGETGPEQDLTEVVWMLAVSPDAIGERSRNLNPKFNYIE
jgi:hypothetical protein